MTTCVAVSPSPPLVVSSQERSRDVLTALTSRRMSQVFVHDSTSHHLREKAFVVLQRAFRLAHCTIIAKRIAKRERLLVRRCHVWNFCSVFRRYSVGNITNIAPIPRDSVDLLLALVGPPTSSFPPHSIPPLRPGPVRRYISYIICRAINVLE